MQKFDQGQQPKEEQVSTVNEDAEQFSPEFEVSKPVTVMMVEPIQEEEMMVGSSGPPESAEPKPVGSMPSPANKDGARPPPLKSSLNTEKFSTATPKAI